MRERVSVLVVLARETLDVVLASSDRALLRPLSPMSEHVCLEVLEDAATLWQWAKAFLACLVVQLSAASALAACAGSL